MTETQAASPADSRPTFKRTSEVRVARRRAGTVERERLLRRLTAAIDTPIVLVSASAGYGKSTLATQWAARCGRPVAWIDLDHGDNDPIVFLTDVAYALDRLDPIAPEILDELSTMVPRAEEVVLPALAAELARLSPVELVFDDVHELTEGHSLAALASLIGAVPAGSQVMLVSRVDPDVRLARRRAAGEVLEIRAEALAFDPHEAQALTTNSGARLSDRSLELLHERTEGWPAGMALALHAARESVSGSDLVEGVSGSQRDIADYFAEVILAGASEEQRRFLRATSVLRRMTGSLCDAVLGTTGAGGELARLERSNSFVIRLDDHGGWYRYHHLFGELLRTELDRSDPGLATTYLSRAAAWYEQDGHDPAEAFRCAHECGDLERAGRIAAAVGDGLVARGQVETLRLWLQECSDEEIESDPQLAIAAGWTNLLVGAPERTRRFIAAAERAQLDVPCAAGATSLRSWLALLRAALAPHGISQMLADSQLAYASERDLQTAWSRDALRGIGTANLLLGNPAQAIESLQKVVLREDRQVDRIFDLGYLSIAAADAGRWADARKWARQARAESFERHLDHTIHAIPGLLAHALVLAHDGETSRAADELDRITNAPSVRGIPWLGADVDLRWGNISLDLGDRVAAREHADAARTALHEYPDPAGLAVRLSELDERIARAGDLRLTAGELRILPYLPTHLSLKEIAGRLHLSRATVKTHVSSIYGKLGVSTRSHAVERLEHLGVQSAGVTRAPDTGEQALLTPEG